MKGKFSIKLGFILLISIILLIGCSSSTETQSGQGAGDKGTHGGTLKLAWNSQPPTLDTHTTNTNVVRDIARQIYENLLTFDENYEIIPMLAESFEESEDRKTITFKLRQGVLFHNGKEMKAEDVVASMTKWQQNGTAKAELGNSKWEAVDEYTVVLHVENPSLSVLYRLADVTQTASIMPKEVIDAADATGVKEFIGTGPFKLEEWKHDSYIKLTKFDDYKPVEAPTSGLGGKKEALVDEIVINFVPDISTRVNGVISGEYDYAFELPFDSYEQLKNSPNVVIDVWPYGFETLVFNKKGIFQDIKLRQAVNHAINNEELLSLAFTDKEFYGLEPAYMRPEQKNWYTKAGEENYNVHDIDKAKQLLEEAEYKGEEVTILTSSDYKYHYDAAVIAQQSLEAIGMKVKLDVTDWATLLERRQEPESWDIFFTQFTTVATPLAYPFLESKVEYPGWTNSPEIDRLIGEIRNASSQEEATAKFEQLQATIWTELPVINIGMTNFISSFSNKVKGYSEFMGPIFWNTSIE
ncbi:ABC transporter substrate-binding protein [Robertmurraya sp. DFI.2.37]|uniref:ABC transporter substrate-binding protein n=1 Tax=Robertmurraya sp. DFI.2.37 TaxID=3031819 RepID=UPI001249145E|nr:ABC transporter substrate-binding protein [Robertmurraya sp. DFI.2.37]MDF1507998.1 ABC transporter substrate-binding protein [Robertmurraya sp. DFI.2.37]